MPWIETTKTSLRVRFRRPDGSVGTGGSFKDRRAAERRCFELGLLDPYDLPGATRPPTLEEPAVLPSPCPAAPVKPREQQRPPTRRKAATSPLPKGAIFAPFDRPYDIDAASNAKITSFARTPTLHEYVQVWAIFQNNRANTGLKDDSFLRCHILPRLGHLPVDQITFLEVEKFYAYLTNALAPESARNVASVLSKILKHAAAQNLIPFNPCKAATLPIEQAPRKEKPIATALQLMHIADRFDRPTEALMVLLAAYTGLRWGEIAGLTWDRVHLHHATPTVSVCWENGALHEHSGHLWTEQPKSLAAVRTVAFPPAFVPQLTAMRTRVRTPNQPVFKAPEGGLLRRSNFERIFKRAVEGNRRHPDLDYRAPIVEGMTFHSLRHMQESWMIADKLDPWIRNYRMGHKSSADQNSFFAVPSEVTEISARYSHMLDEMHREVADLMQRRYLAAEEQYTMLKIERLREHGHELAA